MSSLFKRVTLPLLAVAAATTLCGSTRAATATWAECDAPDPSNPQVIRQQVECSMTDTGLWEKAVFHTQLLGGDESYTSPDRDNYVNINGPGDYYHPSGGYDPVKVTGGGTYNNWCICSGGNSGGTWDVSTGGTTYLYIPSP